MLKTNKITISANLDEVEIALDTISKYLSNNDVSFNVANRIRVALEEVLVNIALYAYIDKKGNIDIEYGLIDNKTLKVIVIDSGIEFDPLKKDDPNIKDYYGNNKIGGFGIYMSKQIMDDIIYQRIDNKNILTLLKNL